MRILIVCLFLLGSVVQAQDYYESSQWSLYEYDKIAKEYSKVGTHKESTRIIVSKEYFALEKSEGGFIVDLWDYDETDELGQWFIPRTKDGAICIGTTDSTVYVFSHFDRAIEKFTAVTALRRIKIIEPFKAVP